MVDTTATLRVQVQGEEQVKSANAALKDFGSSFDALKGKAASIGGGIFDSLKNAFGGIGGAIGGGLRGIAGTVGGIFGDIQRTAFGALSQAAGLAGGAITKLAIGLGPLGIAAGVAAGAVALFSKMGTQGASELAKATVDTSARARRMRTDLATAGREGTVAAQLIGDSWSSVESMIVKRFSPTRLAKGLLGDKGIFARWGITPAAIQKQERTLNRRLGVADWLEAFVRKREDLEDRLAKASSPREKARIQGMLDRLADDTLRMFGPEMAEAIQKRSSKEIAAFRAAAARVSAAFALPPSLAATIEEDSRRLEAAKATSEVIGKQAKKLRDAYTVGPAADLQEFWNQMQLEFLPSWEGFRGAITGAAIKGVTGALKGFTEAMGETDMKGTLEKWRDAVLEFNAYKFGEDIGKWTATQIKAINAAIEDPKGTIESAYESFAKGIKTSYEGFKKLMTETDWGTLWANALEGVGTAWTTAIKPALIRIGADLKAAALTVTDDLGITGPEGIIESTKKQFQDGWKQAKADLAKLGQELFPVGDITTAIKAIFQSMIDAITKAWNEAKSWFMGALSKVTGGLLGGGPAVAAPAAADTSPWTPEGELKPLDAEIAKGMSDFMKNIGKVNKELEETPTDLKGAREAYGFFGTYGMEQARREAAAPPYDMWKDTNPIRVAVRDSLEEWGVIKRPIEEGGATVAGDVGGAISAGGAALTGAIQAGMSGAAAAGAEFGNAAIAIIRGGLAGLNIGVNVTGVPAATAVAAPSVGGDGPTL